MPNPRNKHSKRRTRARRTHHEVEMPQLAVCKTTGEMHVYHNAYWVNNDMYYKGRMVVKGKAPVAVDADEADS